MLVVTASTGRRSIMVSGACDPGAPRNVRLQVNNGALPADQNTTSDEYEGTFTFEPVTVPDVGTYTLVVTVTDGDSSTQDVVFTTLLQVAGASPKPATAARQSKKAAEAAVEEAKPLSAGDDLVVFGKTRPNTQVKLDLISQTKGHNSQKNHVQSDRNGFFKDLRGTRTSVFNGVVVDLGDYVYARLNKK